VKNLNEKLRSQRAEKVYSNNEYEIFYTVPDNVTNINNNNVFFLLVISKVRVVVTK